MLKAGILGATGYAGQELARLLYNHSEISITKLISETYKDKEYSFAYRSFAGINNSVCSDINYETITDGLDVLFTSLPYGILMEHMNEAMLNKVRIIDLGVDYRLMNSDEYEKYYGKKHKSIELSSRFEYGLSEWNEENIKSARHIANPGCFSTAIELALLPIIKEELIQNKIIIDGKCSLSGSGRTLTLGTHYVEASESVKPYKITNHPHKAESVKAIELFTGKTHDIIFVPHIVPMQRGILISCYTKLKNKYNYDYIKDIYNSYYSDKQFIHILEKGMYVETKWVRNSNMCHINFEIDEDDNLIIFAAIDNLIKGAAGQAIQNMNIMYGFPQDTGIGFVPSCI